MRTLNRTLIVLLSATPVWLVGCSSEVETAKPATTLGPNSPGADAGDPRDPPSPEVPPPAPVDASPVDGGNETTPEASVPDGCVPEVATEAQGVFVSTVGGAGASCGTKAAPCATIQAGIDVARAAGKSVVYVSPGVYNEQVRLAAGVSVEGWPATLERGCEPTNRSFVTIVAPSNENKTVLADSLAGAVTLRNLTIKSKPIASAGESLYGIFARGTTTVLTLEDVAIVVASGGGGAPGGAGTAGVVGANCTQVRDGASGQTPGTPGAAGGAGTFTVDGYVPRAGGNGGAGQPGNSGIIGTDNCGDSLPASANPLLACDRTASNGSVHCNRSPSVTPISVCARIGTPGCGGSAGTGGIGGQGGGSSVGLFSWDARVTIVSGDIASANGGGGGTGGSGGSGAAGAPATGVEAQTLNQCTLTVDNSGNPAECKILPKPINPLRPSGPGGTGSAGGGGGGGAGGSSYAVAKGRTALITVSPTATLRNGSPGIGGAGGAGAQAGANGLSGEINQP